VKPGYTRENGVNVGNLLIVGMPFLYSFECPIKCQKMNIGNVLHIVRHERTLK